MPAKSERWCQPVSVSLTLSDTTLSVVNVNGKNANSKYLSEDYFRRIREEKNSTTMTTTSSSPTRTYEKRSKKPFANTNGSGVSDFHG
jgi:hypothetical protein